MFPFFFYTSWVCVFVACISLVNGSEACENRHLATGFDCGLNQKARVCETELTVNGGCKNRANRKKQVFCT